MQEARDFLAESQDVYELIKDFTEADFQAETQFKSWTVYDIIAHLHLFNLAAKWTLQEPDKFMKLMGSVIEVFQGGKSHQDLHRAWAKEESLSDGTNLREAWKAGFETVAEAFADTDPDIRLRWAGPDMSARACIIARQMETWAHAQAIYDLRGVERQNAERLKNIAHLGVTTYSWSFKVNGQTPPLPKPYIRLTSPAGAIWEWNEPQDNNRLEGSATEFCQVVTQCRSIHDISLIMTGQTAKDWITIAQCFAGGAETPPAQGQRTPSEA